MRRLRVLHVISASGRGGAQQVLASLIRAANTDRIASWVACHHTGDLLDRFRDHAEAVATLDFTRWFSAANVRTLAALMASTRCDVVHTHLFRSDLQGGLAAVLARVPIRVTTIHGRYWEPIGHAGRSPARSFISHTYRGIYRLFDRVIAVAGSVADDLADRPGIRVPRSSITVIRNGRDVPAVTPAEMAVERDRLALASDAAVIVTVANFFDVKGHGHLLDAMPAVLARHPHARLVLVGAGPLESRMKEQVSRMRLTDQVRFAGAQPAPERFLALADVVVLPSLSEGLPLTLLEALGLGRPVIATRVGGMTDVIEDGRNGILVPPGDGASLAQAINDVIDDRARAARFGAAGRTTVRTQFSEARMVRDTEELYFELAAAKHLDLR